VLIKVPIHKSGEATEGTMGRLRDIAADTLVNTSEDSWGVIRIKADRGKARDKTERKALKNRTARANAIGTLEPDADSR